MQAELTSLKPSITRMEEVLYIAHQAMKSRVPTEKVQLDVGAEPINRFRTYSDSDADGRQFIMIQAVLHIDPALVDAANSPWEKILDVTSMSLPSIYKV